MRKLLILILITVAVLENLSKAEDDPCVTNCVNTYLNGPEDVTDVEACREVQVFLKCVYETCNTSLYAKVFKTFEGIENEVDEDNFRCTLQFLNS